jgi:pyridoxine 5-phosphate synthase
MTSLSVNLNKIALLRNSRGRDFPNVLDFANKFISLGAKGITIHPRPDERHITVQDAYDLGKLLKDNDEVEFNIEGYPSKEFLALISEIKPTQCTLVPDEPNQLTSDHGWNILEPDTLAFVKQSCDYINSLGVRSAIFIDPDISQIELVPKTNANRIELYTEMFASAFATAFASDEFNKLFEEYRQSAILAQRLGIEVNAGHDLNLQNLSKFLTIDGILEVSIGHELTVESIEMGMQEVMRRYLEICK